MTTAVPPLYVVADGTKYTLRSRGGKVYHEGTLAHALSSFEERGVLGAELMLHLKLVHMPTVLQVIPGGAIVKAVEFPVHDGPAHA